MTSNLSRLVIGTEPNPNCLIRSPERFDSSRKRNRCPSAILSKSPDMARSPKSKAPYSIVFPCSLAFDRAIPEVDSFKTEGVTAKTSYGTLSAAFRHKSPPETRLAHDPSLPSEPNRTALDIRTIRDMSIFSVMSRVQPSVGHNSSTDTAIDEP